MYSATFRCILKEQFSTKNWRCLKPMKVCTVSVLSLKKNDSLVAQSKNKSPRVIKFLQEFWSFVRLCLMFTCFSSWEKQRKWQKTKEKNNSQKNLLTHPITTFSHRLFQLTLFSHKYGVLKRYGDNYGWKTWKETGLVTYGQASHLLFHVVLDPALLFDVQSLLQLVYLQLKFKQSVQCH